MEGKGAKVAKGWERSEECSKVHQWKTIGSRNYSKLPNDLNGIVAAHKATYKMKQPLRSACFSSCAYLWVIASGDRVGNFTQPLGCS